MINRLFQFRLADWITPLAVVALILLLQVAVDDPVGTLRYEREAIADGQWWRLASGHFVHADWSHLFWNLFGVGLVWFLFARDYRPAQWFAIMTSALLAIDLGLALLEPQIAWYVGFSGVLHGCIAAGLIAWLRSERDALTIVVAIGFLAKLAWEHWAGPLPLTATSMSVPVVHEAHSYGALGGAACALGMAYARTSRQPSL